MELVFATLFNHLHSLLILAFGIHPASLVRSLQIEGAFFVQTRGVDEILAKDMETINTTERLAGLRELMKKNKVDIYSM